METTWIENWATIPETPSGKKNGRTHGVCVCDDGTVKVFHQAENGLLTYDPEGKLISAVGGDRWMGAHGLTRIVEDGVEYPLIKLEISSTSHPFYTGKMKLVDTAGRVDKFMNRYKTHLDKKKK